MNIHLKRLDDLEEARALRSEYEWRLNFLTSISATPQTELNDQDLLKWFYQATGQLQFN